jgi:hypothetical protein
MILAWVTGHSAEFSVLLEYRATIYTVIKNGTKGTEIM